MKTCSKCKRSKGLEYFHKNQNYCKVCNAERMKQWRTDNPERVKQLNKLHSFRRKPQL